MLTVGDILRNTRTKKGLSLNDIEKSIRIRSKFLQEIEKNNWNLFSSKIYITGIIKNYSEFLGLESNKMLAFFRRDYERKEEIGFKRRIASKYLTSETKKYAAYSLFFLFLFFFVFFAYQIKLYMSPPTFVVLSPKEKVFKIDEKIKFVGKTDKDAQVTIFGERIFQDKNGVFEYDLPLKNGKNELVIDITGANGKKTIIKKYFEKKPIY